MIRPTYCTIDLGAAAGNVRAIRGALAPNVKLIAVVKADAYGHGSVQVGRTHAQSEGSPRKSIWTRVCRSGRWPLWAYVPSASSDSVARRVKLQAWRGRRCGVRNAGARCTAMEWDALLLSRPDLHVAWRGDAVPADTGALFDRLRGAETVQ